MDYARISITFFSFISLHALIFLFNIPINFILFKFCSLTKFATTLKKKRKKKKIKESERYAILDQKHFNSYNCLRLWDL